MISLKLPRYYDCRISVKEKVMEKIIEEELKITEDKKPTLQGPSISKLNDDCLINIFKHLSIKNRISSERGIFFYYLLVIIIVNHLFCEVLPTLVKFRLSSGRPN